MGFVGVCIVTKRRAHVNLEESVSQKFIVVILSQYHNILAVTRLQSSIRVYAHTTAINSMPVCGLRTD